MSQAGAEKGEQLIGWSRKFLHADAANRWRILPDRAAQQVAGALFRANSSSQPLLRSGSPDNCVFITIESGKKMENRNEMVC